MARTKVAIGVTIDEELLKRLDEIFAKRDENRSAGIERILRNAIEDEAAYLDTMEQPMPRLFIETMSKSPAFIKALGALLAEHVSKEDIERIQANTPKQAQLGRERERAKKGQVKHA